MGWLKRDMLLAQAGTIVTAVVSTACGGAPEHTAQATDTATVAPAPAAAPSLATPRAAGPASPELVALGDSIFHGQVAAGTCAACHGQGGAGGQIAPSLTDAEWLHGDGSYEFIVAIVTNGVTTAKKSSGMMPPKGGAPLTSEQIRAVAAYVYSLGRRG